MEITVKRTVVCSIAIAWIFIGAPSMVFAQEASASITDNSNSPINDKTGFRSDRILITFDTPNLSADTVVTDQWSSFGVTFNSVGGFGQRQPDTCDILHRGLSVRCLGIFPKDAICLGPHSIMFDKPTGIAGFNILTNGAESAQVTARLRGAFVEMQVFDTDARTEHFIGIKNSGGFDELELEIIPDGPDTTNFNGCPLLDNLMFDPVIPVHIDIKPGTDQNSINLCSKGSVPVAVLGSSAIDVYDIETENLRFADAFVKMVGKKDPHILCSYEDVDFDGFSDLVCHFVTTDIAALDGEASSATLKGSLYDGTQIEGTDVVNIVKDTCF